MSRAESRRQMRTRRGARNDAHLRAHSAPHAPSAVASVAATAPQARATGAPYLYSMTMSHQRSYLGGPQCQSHMRSGTSALIGSDHRNETHKKTYLGKELCEAMQSADRDVPGPGQYQAASSVRSCRRKQATCLERCHAGFA